MNFAGKTVAALAFSAAAGTAGQALAWDHGHHHGHHHRHHGGNYAAGVVTGVIVREALGIGPYYRPPFYYPPRPVYVAPPQPVYVVPQPQPRYYRPDEVIINGQVCNASRSGSWEYHCPSGQSYEVTPR